MAATVSETFTLHLIDPVICIHCNTSESTCPVNAISHDERTHVLDPDICDGCNACITPYPTGTIDNWRKARRHGAYTTPEQLGWDELPGQDAELAEDPAPRALSFTKRALNHWLRGAWPAFEHSLALEIMGFRQADAREGFSAYQDTRSPTFKSG